MKRLHILGGLLVVALGLGIWRGPESYRVYQAINLNQKGEQQLFQGQVVAAQESFSQSLAKDPTIYGSWVGLANSYFEQRKFELAVQACDNGLKLDSSKPELFKIKGESLEKLDRSPEAVKAYEEALKIDSSDSLVKRLKQRALAKSKT